MSALLTDSPQTAPAEEGLSSHQHSHVRVAPPSGRPSVPSCLSLQNPDPAGSWGRGPAGTCSSRCHKKRTDPMCKDYFSSLWFLFWLEMKPPSVKKLNRIPPLSPPRHGGCSGRGLIVQRFDVNLCEDSGECESPGATRAFSNL